MQTINERLNILRKTLKKSAKDFGKAIGYSQSTVSLVELGRPPYDNPNKISENYIRMLVMVFNVNEHWLRTGEGEMFSTTKPGTEREALAAQMIELVNQVPPEELRGLVQDFVRAIVDASLITKKELNDMIEQTDAPTEEPK